MSIKFCSEACLFRPFQFTNSRDGINYTEKPSLKLNNSNSGCNNPGLSSDCQPHIHLPFTVQVTSGHRLSFTNRRFQTAITANSSNYINPSRCQLGTDFFIPGHRALVTELVMACGLWTLLLVGIHFNKINVALAETCVYMFHCVITGYLHVTQPRVTSPG